MINLSLSVLVYSLVGVFAAITLTPFMGFTIAALISCSVVIILAGLTAYEHR